MADTIKWSRPPKTGVVERIAELAIEADFYSLGDLPDTSVAERGHPYSVLLSAKRRRDRTMRKILDACMEPQPARPKMQSSSRAMEMFARINSNHTLKGIGELFRPRK